MKHPDHYDTAEKTSRRMAKVKLKHGDVEAAVAKVLYHRGLRYRFDDKRLPGSPDLAILKYHVAVFIDGEFWHGHNWEVRKEKLKRNREYWVQKIEENMERDRRVDAELRAMEWHPLHFWSKEAGKDIERCANEICEYIKEMMLNG